MQKILIIGAIVVFIGIFLLAMKDGDSTTAVVGTNTEIKDLGPIPPLTLKNYDGNNVELESLIGTPLVINSWAAWCPFCVKELPDFVAAQENFGDSVKIIAIDRAEPLGTAKEYTDFHGITDDLVFLLDDSDSFYKEIGGFSMPETIFVDTEGTIRIHKRGPMELPEITEKINALLGN